MIQTKFLILMGWLLIFFGGSRSLGAEDLTPDLPASDSRAHQYLQLDNGLRVMLVSDPNSPMAGVALVVGAGSEDEPDELPGLAHLLEHMLFIGSKRYPELNGFGRFVSAQGGAYNGFTMPDRTMYLFQVQPAALAEGLDRLAQALMVPTLETDRIASELKVVDSEYDMSLGNPDWREMSVFRRALNPRHPSSRFSIGSSAAFADIPADDLRVRLEAFHRQWYQPANMTLAVIGGTSVAELKKMATKAFAAWPKSAPRPERKMPPLFMKDQLPGLLHIAGERDTPRLAFTFRVPPQHQDYRINASRYISNLIMSEKEGHLKQQLKDKGWLVGLQAGSRYYTRDGQTADVFLDLTEAGLKNWPQVADWVFQYLADLRAHGIDPELYAEQGRTAQEYFDHRSNIPAMQYAAKLAQNLTHYPVRDLVTGPYLMLKFDARHIQEYAGHLTPENAMVTLVTPGQSYPSKDSWSKTSYKLQPVSEELLSQWRDGKADAAFAFAHQENPYLASQQRMRPRENVGSTPKEVLSAPGVRVWFKQDEEHKEPKASVYIGVSNPSANTTLDSAALAALYTLMLNERAIQLQQRSQEAGMAFGIQPSARGVLFAFSGLSEKQPALVADVLEMVRGAQWDELQLTQAKAKARAGIDAYESMSAFQMLFVKAMDELIPYHWSQTDQYEVLQKASIADLRAFTEQFWREAQLDVLIYGNYSEKEARALGEIIRKTLTLPGRSIKLATRPNRELIPGKTHASTFEKTGNAALVYMRAERADLGALMLLERMLNDHAFQKLRTEQAMGYAVNAAMMAEYRQIGLAVAMQASDLPPAQVTEAISREVNAFLKGLPSFDAAEFERYRQGAIEAVRSFKVNPVSRSALYWGAIMTYGEPLDESEVAIKQLSSLGFEEYLKFCDRLLNEKSARRFVLMTAGGKEG